MAMLLTRGPEGVLLNHCEPIVLRGGHYHLFGKAGGVKYVTETIGSPAFRICFPSELGDANPDGCPRTHRDITLHEQPWTPDRSALLDAVEGNGCNFLRIFLSDGVDLDPAGNVVSLVPFERAGTKWRVAAAIRDNVPEAWSAAYFERLAAFAGEADDRGVVLQVSLFSHHDMRADLDNAGHSYWPRSWWNPANVDDPAFGPNLVTIGTGYLGETNEDAKGRLRNQDFLNVARGGLMTVQKRMVEKVLATLCPLGNVILELNNEPRLLNDQTHPALPSPGVYQATWLNTATGWIVDWLAANAGDWRPLISANAAPPRGLDPPMDVDTWAAHPELARYGDLDAISYHGLTGLRDTNVAAGDAHCGKTLLPRYDPASIAERVDGFRTAHAGKSLILSTDAARSFPQRFGPDDRFELERRDGQVCTSLDSGAAATVGTQRARGDLDNWAFWVLRHGFGKVAGDARVGAAHFQNHSATEPSLMAVGAAAGAVQGLPQPARNMGSWGRRHERTTGVPGNFWTAHRFNPATGEIVNQLGTQNPQQAVDGQGLSAIGWRYDFSPATAGRFAFEVDYQPVSVSDVETGGGVVTPRVAVTLYAVGAGGGLGAQLARAERSVYRDAPPGTLAVAANLAAGARVAAVMTGEVAITYAARKQGYGETILRFVEMRLCGAP